ncbi:MAG: TraB/GumN family protein [Bacteroidota bacterium]|nr:TraB/GumN family protein [Bacteroidota bacterium]
MNLSNPKGVRLLLPTLILLLFSTAFAHPKSSLLWEISGHGLKTPSYLYGTVHSFDERAFRFAKLAESYIAKCEAFGMEINMSNLEGVDIFGMMKYITMPGDTTLDMLMTPQQYAKLDAYVTDTLHLSLAMFKSIKPMFLLGMQEGMSLSTDSSDFLDEYFMKFAEKHKKEIIGIETIEEQVRALDLVPLKEQAKMVMDMIEPDTTKPEASIEDLVDIYARGDLDAIYSYYKKEDLSNTFNAALITDRNHRMADRIDSIMHKKSLFVAIGALHLPGDEGLINLLRKKGYALTPLWKKD